MEVYDTNPKTNLHKGDVCMYVCMYEKIKMSLNWNKIILLEEGVSSRRSSS